MFTFLVKNLPPKLSAKLYFFAITIRAIYFVLTRRIGGLLLLLFAIYLILMGTKYNKPFSLSELTLFIDGLSENYKIALFTSLVTIVGILITFLTAITVWKKQTIFGLRDIAAREIESFFSEVQKLIMEGQVFAKELTEAINAASRKPDEFETIYRIHRITGEREKFEKVKERLAELSLEILRVQSKHFLVLSSQGEAGSLLKHAASLFNEITTSMWIYAPALDLNSPKLIDDFLRFTSAGQEKAVNFGQLCEKNGPLINGIAAGVRWALLSPVIDTTPAALWGLLITGPGELESAFTQLHDSYRGPKK